ncbi:YoaK family protein [Methylobacterium sp. NEAU 140]|uniref:YoaK family protein n=1 Tax=Methylobacterium sp. NEAU 140 TaxID=3064945 RepID=UPI00273634B8|nr:YoaK family protein [Methylobacterium sp. NEAU 140]MDP4023057.1 YoaK family protein [Methylobacterium sp. NEAU 140]
MTRPWQLGTGLALTALAGYVDALGFLRLGGLYTSFMSGNTTQLGVFTAEGKGNHLILPLALLTGFLAGAVVGSGIGILAPSRWSTPIVLAFEAALLAAALGLGLGVSELGVASVSMAVAMGAQNAVLAQVKGFRAGATFVTGALFSFGQKIAQALTRTGEPWGWVGDGLVWLFLLLGAILGAHVYGLYGLYALALPAIAAAVFALVSTALIARSTRKVSSA